MALSVGFIGTLTALYFIVNTPQKTPSAPKHDVLIPAVLSQKAPPRTARTAQPMEAGRPAPQYDNVAEPREQPALEMRVVKFELDRPVTIWGFLRDAGVSTSESGSWAEAFRSAAPWGILSPGHQVTIYKDPRNDQVRALEYDYDDNSIIRAEDIGGGVVLATREPLRYRPQTVAYSLSLADGLDVAAARKHLPGAVVEQIKYAFATRMPGLETRGTLKLVYKELVTMDGQHHRDQDLQACKIQSGRRSFCAFAFNDGRGREHLYDEYGNSLEPQFLRFPVAFQYISSSFSPARYHPILHRFLPHAGIDLAARYGSPVQAISDGRIQFADWDGGLGRCVRIQHDSGLVSVYAHLSAISPEVKPGTPVRLGQVIGFVGSSGLSTGPHLHYALYKDGRFLDPMTVNLDGSGTGAIAGDLRPMFQTFRREFEKVFARLHPGVANAAVTDPTINRLEAFNSQAEPAVHFAMPPSGFSIPGSLNPPRVAAPRREVHLARGGLLRESRQRISSSAALDRLINSGLIGEPSM